MKRNNVLSLIFIALLSMICVFTLSACGKNTTSNPTTTVAPSSSTTTEVKVTTTNTPSVDVSVSYDEKMVFDSETIENISDFLNVEVVINGVRQKIDFTVKDYTISEDGQYADVVINAYGMEKTIRVPFDDATPIRPELKEIYDLLSVEGDKSFTLSLSGSTNENSNLFTCELLVNILEDGSFEFALVNENKEVLALFKDGALVIGSYKMSVDSENLLSLLGSLFETSTEEVVEEEVPSTRGVVEEEEEVEGFDLYTFIAQISSALDNIDKAAPMASLLGITLTVEDGSYFLSIDSATLLSLISAFVESDETEEFSFNDLVDAIDSYMDGALKAGKVQFDINFAIKGTKVAFGFTVTNTNTEGSFTLNLNASLFGEAQKLPTIDEMETEEKDVELSFGIKLPAKEINSVLTVVLHTSQMLSEENADILTATLKEVEGPTLVEFVINNHYMFLDLTGLNNKMKLDEEAQTLTFYEKFEIDGEEATFAQVLAEFINKQMNDEETEEPINEGEIGEPTNEEEETIFDNGYGACPKDGVRLFFNIGVTEDELRNSINVYTYDKDDNQIEYTDYTVVDFDGSKSFIGYIDIKFDENHTDSVFVIIYDASNVSVVSVEPERVYAPLGITIAELINSGYIYAIETFTDGSIEWTEYTSDFNVTSIAFEDNEPVVVNSEYQLQTLGDCTIKATYKEVEYEISGYVFDPENLKIVDYDCDSSINLYSMTTEEELKNYIYLYAIYDNDEKESIEDFEIVGGFEYGDKTVTIKHGDFTQEIEIIYDSQESEEEEEGGFDIFELLSYFRFFEINGEMTTMDMIQTAISNISSIVEENNEEFEGVATFTNEEGTLKLLVNVNTEDNKDVMSVINYFVGKPTEDGFEDIDADFIKTVIESLKESDEAGMIIGMLETILGFEATELVDDSVLEVTLSLDGGLNLNLYLYGASKTYMEFGFECKLVDLTSNFSLTEEMVNSSKEFSELNKYLFKIIFGALA